MISAVTVILACSSVATGFVQPPQFAKARPKNMPSSKYSGNSGLFTRGYHGSRFAASDGNLRRAKESAFSKDQAVWQCAPEPNYSTNLDLEVPYSLGEYGCNDQAMLNRLTIRSDILDFWGEGRTEGGGVETGFRESYNVNYQYQLVSPGADDAGRKIPNRIPTITHENSDIRLYVATDTFKFVTLMGSPINREAAQEMTRVVKKKGLIILYGIASQAMVDILEAEASRIGFVHDKFSSFLVTEILGLEAITVPEHPRHTRVYHSFRSIQSSTCVSQWQSVGKESGIDEDCTYSEFVVREGEVLVGLKQRGDENGETWYKSGMMRLSNGNVSAECFAKFDKRGWVRVERESGEPSHVSSYICPEGAVLMGRKHQGGENGDTWYKYGWITLNGKKCETYDVSGWIDVGKESDSDNGGHSEFTCTDGTVLVGRHGDANSKTCYKYAKIRIVGL